MRCFRCREYDHFANECPNDRVDDSDGYESHSAVLQLMTGELDTCENFDSIRVAEEEQDDLNLKRLRMLPPHSCLKRRKVDKSGTKLLIYDIEKRNV